MSENIDPNQYSDYKWTRALIKRDAEIERLKELAESWKGAHSVASADRDIAQAKILDLSIQVDLRNNWLKKKNQLIDELADALAFFGPLVDRARKETKDGNLYN